ncbi:hypothetical protein ACQZ6I_06505 [Agrobacterium vitis]|uniref:hypothetical protein n=1 Tax=Agrobacterium vitis TaxID=373 RepID=UPI001F430BC5|nr:hypothetical protein [Agrobacterium vitis]MCF1452307.1 hypothetical protein [Agrobacterium vitis]
MAQASTKLPDYPTYCRAHMTRPPIPKIGDLARQQDEKWEVAADASDRRTDFCGSFYDQVKTSYGAPITAAAQ